MSNDTTTTTYSEFLDAVKGFQSKYRKDDMEPFKISGLYDLFPNHGPATLPCEHKWPDTWPYCDKAGIYAFFDEAGILLYVGKASMNSDLGARLGSYYVNDSDKNCLLKNYTIESMSPRYVITVCVPDDTKFEAAALEEFLISQIHPLDNVMGRRK